jgi:hypothetical protein
VPKSYETLGREFRATMVPPARHGPAAGGAAASGVRGGGTKTGGAAWRGGHGEHLPPAGGDYTKSFEELGTDSIHYVFQLMLQVVASSSPSTSI